MMECLRELLYGIGGGFIGGAICRIVSLLIGACGCIGALCTISILLICQYFFPDSMLLRGLIGGFIFGYLIITKLIVK